MNEINVDIKTLDLRTLKALVYDGLKSIEALHGAVKNIQQDLATLNAEIDRKQQEAFAKQAISQQAASALKLCDDKSNGCMPEQEKPHEVA